MDTDGILRTQAPLLSVATRMREVPSSFMVVPEEEVEEEVPVEAEAVEARDEVTLRPTLRQLQESKRLLLSR